MNPSYLKIQTQKQGSRSKSKNQTLKSSSYFILNHGAGIFKQTIPQYPPSHFQDYSTRNSAR